MSKKKYAAKNGFTPESLLHFGYDHLDSGKFLLQQELVNYFESAGYLIGLGFELVFKAWLLHLSGEFPGIHGVVDLFEKIQSADSSVVLSKENEKTLKYIAQYKTLRYPSCPTAGEIGDDDLESINALEDAVWLLLPDVLKRNYEKINPTRKGKGRIRMQRPIDKSK